MKALPSLAALAVLAAAPVHADCSYPTPPEKIPDGNTATLEDMVTAQKAVKDYDKAITAYLSCIKLEHDDAVTKGGDKLTKEQLADLERVENQKHNAAVDQLQGIADRFNDQVKVYKAKNDKSKG